MENIHKQVLFKVLKEIDKGGTGNAAAPNTDYLNALEVIGYINKGWDTTLTSWGHELLRGFQNEEWR